MSFLYKQYQSSKTSISKVNAWGGAQEETEAREEGTDGVGRGYLVLFETRAGRIRYQSLFVEETLRL